MNREFEIKQRGSIGEKYVCSYLEDRSYTIVDTNYRSRYGEIDIIAQKGNIIAFVEVKTRTASSMTCGFESVTKTKISKIMKTIGEYFVNNKSFCQPRMDCAEVIVSNTDNSLVSITYIENAVEYRGMYSPL